MSRILQTLSGLLAGALLMSAASAEDSRPRGPAAPPPRTAEEKAAAHAQLAQDTAAWLPRLVGRFTVEGVIHLSGVAPETATGKVDCIPVGDGPGVHCLLYVTWEEVWGDRGETITGGVPFLGPASILYGLDLKAAEVRYMQLDTDGVVTDGPARLNGNTLALTFDCACPSEASLRCVQTIRTYAPPEGKYLHMTIEVTPRNRERDAEPVDLDLELRPIPRDETVPGK